MRNTLITLFALMLLVSTPGWAQEEEQETPPTRKQVERLEQELEDLEDRLMEVEKASALDRLSFRGDFRFQAHSINADVPSHFDGMLLQKGLVDTLFHYGATGTLPASPEDVGGVIAENYADYLYFTQNLSFDDLKSAMGMFSPEMQQQLFGSLLPATYTPAYPADNDIMYTNRLRLEMHADLGSNVSFAGRLSMYKVFGDSTGAQVFNGQPTSFNIDGTTATVPNSDILRVERAYFTWSDIGGAPVYLSIGRRPSTGGVPLNFREDEPRGGTPMGSLINYQFDGITLGWHLGELSTIRLCYGVGYESGFGNGEVLELPQDRLDDAVFLGINWDVWDTESMFVQATVARAFDVTDGFNGLVVLPNNPVTGQEVGAPVVMRFTPSANLGDIDLASLVISRNDGPFDYFASINYMESDPNDVTTPFGGLFSDPFEQPEAQDGTMFYLGARYTLPNDATKIGLEFNHGSEYWFNFAHAEDDIIAPKTAARGDVWEAYLTHRITRNFVAKVAYIDYQYDYSGSGWHIGAPKDLDSQPILGFPTYESASMLTLGMSARF